MRCLVVRGISGDFMLLRVAPQLRHIVEPSKLSDLAAILLPKYFFVVGISNIFSFLVVIHY